MSLSPLNRKAVLCGFLALAVPFILCAQTPYVPASGYLTNGGEFAIAGTAPGDQVYPAAAITATGGFLVWEDNISDTNGLGISAMQLDPSLSGEFSSFRVNQVEYGEQERPRVSVLKEGGAVFVWQGGPSGKQRIFARFRSPSNAWITGDIRVNSFDKSFQAGPAVATLASGNVIVVWVSYNQQSDNTLHDVYGQLLSPTGQKIGGEFLINQFLPFNQRTPTVAPLESGGFVVAWISEQQQRMPPTILDPNFQYHPTNTTASVDVYARLYQADGQPLGSEFLANPGLDICANPAVAASANGGFLVAWGQRDLTRSQVATNSWDIFARAFSSSGSGGTARRVNTLTYGDQYAPRVASTANDFLVVWSSMGQDGAMEGVYGQVLRSDGSLAGEEFRVNTTWVTQQIHPAIASDRHGRFLVAWTSFIGGTGSFDLFAQRYVKVGQPLPALNAPFVTAPFTVVNGVYQPRLEASWSGQPGLMIDHYELFVDGAAEPTVSLKTNFWAMTAAQGLTTNSTHSFQVVYVTADQVRSPTSPAASATTWGGLNWAGIPWEWMTKYYGPFAVSFNGPVPVYNWPAANASLSAGGPTVSDVFLSGGSPLDQTTWLKTAISSGDQGFRLSWNPLPGQFYQVQTSTNLGTWVNLGGARLAADTTDSIYVGRSNAGYYRVLLMR
jgi:hypothetical protein